MTDTTQDLQRLAASGRVPPPAVMAARARRWGWWYYVEYWLRAAKAWALSIVIYMIGEPLLYLIALGLGLGSLVDNGVGTVDGVSYLVFVAPALLISTVVMSTGAELTYPVMAGFKWDRLYYGPHATPVTPAQIGTGHFLGVLIRFTVQASIFWVMMILFAAVPRGVAISALVIPIGVLSAAAFGALLQAYASTLQDEGYQFSFVQRFVIMPMFLFAGTFFPLSAMPIYLHWIGWISPVWHGTQLARQVTYGATEPTWLTLVHIAFLGVCTLIGVLWMRRSYARRMGS